MLTSFTIRHDTDGNTRCTIVVQPQIRGCDVSVTVDGRIVIMCDELDTTFRTVGFTEWFDITFWERKAASIAKFHSPFYKGETAV